MRDPSAGTIVFNGELYDHVEHRKRLQALGERFLTTSDTEVLLRGLAREGHAFLEGLHGMYAFAWLSPDGRKFMLGRDHAGMKPLYYRQRGSLLAFASEVRTLGTLLRTLDEPVRVDSSALAGFMSLGSVPEPHTVLNDVRMLPAGTVLELDPRSPAHSRIRHVSPRTVADAVVPAVRRAVQRHLVSDRPVAVFLSSGLDSGVLAAEVADLPGVSPTAISVNLGTRGAEDEPALVGSLCSRLGLPLHIVELTDWKDRLRSVWDAFDQPSVDGMNTFIISSAARELGFPVALSGVGADEVFGGYPHLRWHDRFGPTLTRAGRFGGRHAAAALVRAKQPSLRRAGLVLDAAARRTPVQAAWRHLLPHRQVLRLFRDIRPASSSVDERDVLAFERGTYLRDTLLRDTDVMGMAHGLEIRAPFLDPDVLAAAGKVGTDALLAKQAAPKWPLREGWGRVLELETLRRRKSGFVLDIASWLKERELERFFDAISSLENRKALHRPTLVELARRARTELDSPRPTAWVTAFSLIQLARAFETWGDP